VSFSRVRVLFQELRGEVGTPAGGVAAAVEPHGERGGEGIWPGQHGRLALAFAGDLRAVVSERRDLCRDVLQSQDVGDKRSPANPPVSRECCQEIEVARGLL
jgi:hypothetical protein